MSIMDDLQRDMGPIIEKSFKDLLKQAGEDTEVIHGIIEDELGDIVHGLLNGKSMDEIVKEKDTASKMLVAAALFSLTEQQVKTIKATRKLLDDMIWTVLKKVVIALVPA